MILVAAAGYSWLAAAGCLLLAASWVDAVCRGCLAAACPLLLATANKGAAVSPQALSISIYYLAILITIAIAVIGGHHSESRCYIGPFWMNIVQSDTVLRAESVFDCFECCLWAENLRK